METCLCMMDACVFDGNVFLCDGCPVCLMEMCVCVMDACVFDGNVFLCDGSLCV